MENQIDCIVFENGLEQFKDSFKDYKKLDGKYMMRRHILKIIEYIFKTSNKNMNLEDIYVFVNNYTKLNIYLIEMLVERFKTVNIITENLKYYRILENKLYEKGILITVSNNLRKGAKRAKYILNVDYTKEKFEKYNINMESIIINLTEENVFFETSFNGILVNNFEIEIDENEKVFINEYYGEINPKLYLESELLNQLQRCENEKQHIENYPLKIKFLIGVRGEINNCEFLV